MKKIIIFSDNSTAFVDNCNVIKKNKTSEQIETSVDLSDYMKNKKDINKLLNSSKIKHNGT